MAKVILGLTLSLDGFAEDLEGSVGKLYPDLNTLRNSSVLKESMQTTGAVVMSKKQFEMPEDPDVVADSYEYQVPIFVFTDQAPKKHPKENDKLTFTFVSDIESAIVQAKAAAGDKVVTIIGSAETTRLCLPTGLADELHIDIIPIFLQTGHRPFDGVDDKAIRLERIKVVEMEAGRTHLRFRFVS